MIGKRGGIMLHASNRKVNIENQATRHENTGVILNKQRM